MAYLVLLHGLGQPKSEIPILGAIKANPESTDLSKFSTPCHKEVGHVVLGKEKQGIEVWFEVGAKAAVIPGELVLI